MRELNLRFVFMTLFLSAVSDRLRLSRDAHKVLTALALPINHPQRPACVGMTRLVGLVPWFVVDYGHGSTGSTLMRFACTVPQTDWTTSPPMITSV